MEDKADLFVKPYLVNPLCFRKKKKKWRQSELIFHIKREARLISQNPLTLPTSPPLPLSFWKVRERQKHMTDSQEWQHIRNSFDV